ncbi:vesicle transport protein SEC20 isoform X3 [Echeneis naucrates]|uniref:vesicle transport protein SEC20 isoform X3 n=1 Tax=Echeneis naucrates TaxID=173247 RepID=UPI001113DEEA|nr:vesicle transport protein SEC20-like isoform X3 [Echeneis naucrates]
MASSADVHVRICGQEIIKYDLEIKALIQDIRDCPGPQSALRELNSQVKEKFNKLRLRIQVQLSFTRMMVWFDLMWCVVALAQDLEQLAREQDREMDRQAIQAETESQRGQMLRKATKESLVETSSNITESLMSISRMMAEQVKQSEDSISTLATSSRTVQETNEEFKNMTGTIHLGRKLILKYNRRELTDKLLIFLALALFLATVLYILKKRLFPFI